MTQKAKTQADYSGWRGGIGICFDKPAANMADVTELGIEMIWGGQEWSRPAFLDMAPYHYWSCTPGVMLKDPKGRWDFSDMEDKLKASYLALDRQGEILYGVKGLSKFATLEYTPDNPYVDATGSYDFSTENDLVRAVIDTYCRDYFDKKGLKRGGIALDNAGKVSDVFLNALQRELRKRGLGIAANGSPEKLSNWVDFFGNERFPYSQAYARKLHEKGFSGILGEFPIRHMSPGEFEAYLKAKLPNGIVFFGYTDDYGCTAALVRHSLYHYRPDVYNHHRWVLRKILPVSRALVRAGRQKDAMAETAGGTSVGGPEEIRGVVINQFGGIDETATPIEIDGDMFNGTLALDGSVVRFGSKPEKGLYFVVNSYDCREVTCDADKLGIPADAVVWDEYAEKLLDATRKDGKLKVTPLSAPAVLQIGTRERIVRNLVRRVTDMLERQALQRKMDGKFGVGYPKAWAAVPNEENEKNAGGAFDPLKPWEPFCQGYVIDGDVRCSGTVSLRADGGNYGVHSGKVPYYRRCGAAQLVNVNQSEPCALTLRGFSKADGVPRSDLHEIKNRRDHFQEREGHFYSMHLYVDYQDGDWPEIHTVSFSEGTHDWEEKSITVEPKKPVRTAMVLLEFHQPSGRAWFDEIHLSEDGSPDTNLLCCGDFENTEIARAARKNREYDAQLAQTIDDIRSRCSVSMDLDRNGLFALSAVVEALHSWVREAHLSRCYGRECRDLEDAAARIEVCCRILKA